MNNEQKVFSLSIVYINTNEKFTAESGKVYVFSQGRGGGGGGEYTYAAVSISNISWRATWQKPTSDMLTV